MSKLNKRNYIDGRCLVKYYCKICGKRITYKAKRCQKCYLIWLKKNVCNFKFLSKKGNKNPAFGRKRPDLSKYNREHPQKGKNNPAYKDGRTMKIYHCEICNRRIKYKSKRCRKHYNALRIAWNNGKNLKNRKCRHHLDLNKENNSKSNLLILTNSLHLKFHNYMYRYVINKYGIKEILKYKKWFFTKGIFNE